MSGGDIPHWAKGMADHQGFDNLSRNAETARGRLDERWNRSLKNTAESAKSITEGVKGNMVTFGEQGLNRLDAADAALTASMDSVRDRMRLWFEREGHGAYRPLHLAMTTRTSSPVDLRHLRERRTEVSEALVKELARLMSRKKHLHNKIGTINDTMMTKLEHAYQTIETLTDCITRGIEIDMKDFTAAQENADKEEQEERRRLLQGKTDTHTDSGEQQQEKKKERLARREQQMKENDKYFEPSAADEELSKAAGGFASGKSPVVLGIFASDLAMLVLFKLLRVAIQVATLFAAQKVFQETYVRKVHAEKKDPPPLWNMLLVYLSFDATLQIVLMIVTITANYVFNRGTPPAFRIDDMFLKLVLVDFLGTTLVTLALGMALAHIIRRKRFFMYKRSGLSTSTAYRDILTVLIGVTFFVPFGLLMT